MILYERYQPLLKRVPTIIDLADDVQRWDRDNRYPQRCDEIIARSYTLKSCLGVLNDFVSGEGFEDLNLNSIIVNEKGKNGGTLYDLLQSVKTYFNSLNSVAIHVGYDMNYKPCSYTPLPVPYCRLGVGDDDGIVTEVKYSTNWEQDNLKSKNSLRVIHTYPIFNPSKVAEEVEACGGFEKYKGQIFFWTPEEFQYPHASFDSVFEHAQAQYESSLFKISSLQNGFMATTAIVYPGEFTDDREREEFKRTIERKKGGQGGNSIIGLQVPQGVSAQDVFQTLTPANVDKQWEYTERSVVDAILENYAMPKELLGVRPETGMFNQDNVESAYQYFNAKTRNRRMQLSKIFSFLMEQFAQPVISDFKIKELVYGTKSTVATPEVEAQANDVIRNLSRKQLQRFYAFINDFKSGRATLEQTKVFIKPFGLTDEQIELFLNDNEADDPIIEPNG
jgi:hypothetical protein